MRRARRGKHEHFSAESHDSLTLQPLDLHHHRSPDRDHQDPTSPSSASHPPTLACFVAESSPRRRRRRKPQRESRNRKFCGGEAEANEAPASVPAIGEGADGAIDEGEREESEVEGESGEECETSNKDVNESFAERLEELRIGVEEPELSEEQLRSNSQAQEDELLVMESIYGDNVLKYDTENGLLSFQVHIDVEVPNGITVSTKLKSSADPKTTGDDFLYSFKVQYLPPIVLSCLLPKSYPSKSPPYFTLSVQWLNPTKISKLCSMLDSIWKEKSGQEIIYQWVEWLSSYSLSYLELENEVMLGPYGVNYTEGRRIISGSVSPDLDVPFIKSYNDERLRESFLQNFHECCICFSEYAGTEFARLPCHHFFCWNCMKTYSDMHVTEGTVNKLQCPETKCGGAFPPSLLKRLLSHEEYERWETLTLQKTLESMSDIAYCPRCEMPCIEDEDQHAQCAKCFFSFCTLCRERRHVGDECMAPELKLRILQERQNSSQLKDGQRRKELEMINEILSVKVILRDAKQCPSCKMAISRIEGCNKMVCNNCGQYFCYRCNKAIDGYDHFREGTCDLFPQEAIRDWEERINPRQVLGQIRAEMFAQQGQGQLCPNCGQFNAKVGNNNHLFCWACQVHYCYLCKKTVRRSSQHYGPRGCKQHSVG